MLSNNTYLLFSGTSKPRRKGVLIDPTGCFDAVNNFINKENIEIIAVFLTHGHFDHVLDVPKWQNRGIKVFAHPKEMFNLNSNRTLQMLKVLGLPNILINEELTEKKYVFDDIIIDVIHTPGHTEGSCCFVVEDNIFSGDTLFFKSFGRTDFPDGDFDKIKKSLIKLFTYSDLDYKVYPGHEEVSSLYFEKIHNPILMYF